MEASLAVAICLILASILSIELKTSSAVLEIGAGIVLALLIKDINHVEWLDHLAHIGMLALMFVAGFELHLERLKDNWKANVSIGLSSFLVPLCGIYLLTSYVLGLDPMTAILVSIGLSTTSLALVYHLLKDHNILDTNNGQIMFGAASIVDILSMVALAMLLGDVGWGTALFILLFVLSLISLPHFGAWLFKRYPNSTTEPELRFLMVILVSMGFMAENVGNVHPALVAFTVGIVMSGVIEHDKTVEDKLLGLVFSFFAPIFFLHAGTKIDLATLSPSYILIGGMLLVAATSLKYLGTYLPARLFMKKDARFGGVLFNYRLSFGIVTANVGLAEGILTPSLYGVIMLVVVISAALPGLILRRPE